MGVVYRSLRRWFGAATSIGRQAGIQMGEPFTRVSDPALTIPTYGPDGALQLSPVWAVTELLVDTVASLPLFVYKRSNDLARNKELVPSDNKLFRLLHGSPNRYMTSMEFMQCMTINFLFRGNAYARVVRDASGEAIELLPMPSDQVEVEVMPDGSVTYKFYYEGVVKIYSEKSILHWKDKGNGIVGLSRLDFMNASVHLGIQAQNHAANTFRKSGKRPGVFMIDKLLTKEQRENIRASYSGLTEGSDDDLFVLEAGAKFEPLSMTPADLQIMETRRFTIEEVARWFGVPSVLINDTSKSSGWGAGIQQIIEGFHKFRLRAIVASLEQAIAMRVMTANQRARYTAEYSMEALLRGSFRERVELGVKLVQNGLMTRNEWRQLENLPPMDGGEKLTAQTNLVPVNKLGENPPAGSAPGGGEDEVPPKNPGDDDDQTQDEVQQ